jgi:glycosyltransferase involved in cell wall biosynthesis
MTVSVPSLKRLYEPFCKNIYVNPNGIDFKIFDKLRVKGHKGIRIGWRGAYGHRRDLELVYPAIKALIKDYGVEFVVLGVSPKDGLAEPDFPVEWNEWVSFGDEDIKHKISYPFYEKLADLKLDIAVVPLIDSSYNRCKSNLNVLEFSALKIPVVASPTENQKNMPCLYASSNYEWYDRLEKLVKSPKLRNEYGEWQYRFVKKHFNMKSLVFPLNDWMSNLKRRKDLEL